MNSVKLFIISLCVIEIFTHPFGCYAESRRDEIDREVEEKVDDYQEERETEEKEEKAINDYMDKMELSDDEKREEEHDLDDSK